MATLSIARPRTTTSTSSTSQLRVPRGVALALLASSMFLIVLDGSMVNLAASSIRDGLRLTSAELAVVANTYLIAQAGMVLLGGRLADVLGGRRVFLAGISLYVLASSVSALSVNGPMLIAGRLAQGLGAAVTVPAALSLVLGIYQAATERTRALGIWGAVAGGGSLLGVFAGGVLTQLVGWQSVFWVPVPIGIGAALLVRLTVPASPGRPGRFDVAGALSITAGVTALALGSVNASQIGWTAPATLLALAVGVLAVAWFVRVERRSGHPLVPLGVLRRTPVWVAALVMMLAGGTLTGLFFFLPLYQHDVLHMSALDAGLAQVPIAVMIIVGSVLAPVLSRWLGLPRALPVSLVVLLAGLLWIALNPATSFTWEHVAAFVLTGLGLGLALVNATAMAVRDSADGQSGLLSGLVNAAQSLGGALGLAVLAGVALTAGIGGRLSFVAAFLGAAGLVALAVALSAVTALRSRRVATSDN